MYLWISGLNLTGLVILSIIVLVIFCFVLFIVSKIWMKIKKPIQDTTKIGSYCTFILNHRKTATIILIVLFIFIGFSISWIYNGDDTFASYSSELISDPHLTDYYGIELTPYYKAQMWISDDDYYVSGSFYVNDTLRLYARVEFGDVNRSLDSGFAWIGTDQLESGLYYLVFYYNSNDSIPVVSRIGIYVSKLSLEVFQVVTYFQHLTTFLIVTEVLFFPITYFFVVIPSRKVIDEIPTFSRDFSVPKEFKLEKDLLERTNQTIQYLSSRTDYYSSKRSSLLTTAGVLLAVCTALPTIMITLLFDSQVLNAIFYFVFWSALFITAGILYLHKSTTNDFMPSSSWFFRKRINDESSSEEDFNLDLTRNFYSFIQSEKEDYLKENVSEIVTLYYILRNAADNYDSAFFAIAAGAANLCMGIFFVFAQVIKLSEILLIAIAILLGFLLYTLFRYVKSWLDDEISSEILTIYYCFDSLKENNPMHKEFREIIVNHFSSSLGIVDTCQYDDAEREALFNNLTEETKEHRKSLKWKFVDFSVDGSLFAQFAKEIPILVVRKIGENKSVIVYPCIDKNERTLKIADFLTKGSKL